MTAKRIRNYAERICTYCGKSYRGSGQRFCSRSCATNKQYNITICEIDDTHVFPSDNRAKTYLIATFGVKCMICGISEWMGKTTPIVLDHIDGNSENRHISNYRLICPNCDAQTPTYKAKNMGNGRHSRRQRYADGKSY